MGVGGMALADLLHALPRPGAAGPGVLDGALSFAPRAKRVIYLFMAGGPSQLETFDYKPLLNQRQGRAAPGFRPHGTTAHGHVWGIRPSFRLRVCLQIPAGGEVRRLISEVAAAHGGRGG